MCGGRCYRGRRERGEKVQGLVVIYAWMSSEEKHVQSYVDLYASLGWNSLVCHSQFLNMVVMMKQPFSLGSCSSSLRRVHHWLQKVLHELIEGVLKDLKVLYNESRSNSCIEHALGIMELEKAPEKLSEKISTMSFAAREMKLGNFLLDKLDAYESAVGDANTRGAPRIGTFPPAFQAVPLNPTVLDLAYNSIEFPALDNRMKKDKKGLFSRFWG